MTFKLQNPILVYNNVSKSYREIYSFNIFTLS